MGERHDRFMFGAARSAIATTFIALELWIVLGVLLEGVSLPVRVLFVAAGPVVAVLLGVHAYGSGRDGDAR